jgi:hypothetical protein
MYKSLSEMKPGQKFVDNVGSENIIYRNVSLVCDGGRVECNNYLYWRDNEVDWVATNALYAETDTYTAEIHEVMQKQLAKGKAKYGLTLEDGTVGIIESIDHAIEEVVDQLYYLVHLKAKLREKDV